MENFLERRDPWRVAGLIIATLYVAHAVATPTEWHLIDTINLIYHEAGHTLAMFFGEFIQVLAGSAFQVIIPLVIAVYFYLRNDLFATGVMLMWAGESMIGVSVYAGDAIVMRLPLLGGDDTIHDWNYLLSVTHLLRHTAIIANIIYVSGAGLIISGVLLGVIGATKKDL